VVLAQEFSVDVWKSRAAIRRPLTEGTAFLGRDLIIRDTAQGSCEPGFCSADGGYGVGLATLGSAIDLERFIITRSGLCGLQLVEGGVARLSEGLVSHNPIGVNVQTEGLNLDELSHRVFYLDNGRNLDSERLPVPLFGDLSGGGGGEDAGR
jgi:hypothetical protein